MIPARAAAPSAPGPESVSSRLNRLRVEHAAVDRPSFRSAAPSPADSTPRWLSAALSPAAPPIARRAFGRRGTAGPPAPASWSAPLPLPTPTEAVDGRDRQGSWMQPVELIERRKLAAPLQGKGRDDAGVPSLFTAAGGAVAVDLARGDASLLLEHVAYLPNHLRLRLVDVFADWRSPAPLTSDGAVELLRTDISEGVERELDEDGVPLRLEQDEDDWERADGGDGVTLEGLTQLDFSFSSISLRTLRSLLLQPASSSSASASSRSSTPASTAPPPSPSLPKLVPVFPLLTTLNLTSTSRLPFSDTFFDTLSLLISLRSLSLCGKTLEHPSSSVTSATFLPRLAAATPTLVQLDLSYMDFPHVAVKGVDWDTRWLQLKVLGLRRELVDWQGDEVGPDKKERIKREAWQLISQGRKKPRRWIEIII
ncbi:hypothetical protein JCM10207_001059 [Rhodosporidiobolus poonsookiae]